MLIDLGEAKLSSFRIEGLSVKPRMIPLLYGPTGAGKTYIAESVAKELGAGFAKVEVSSWIPVGAREGAPTTKALTGALSSNERLVFFIDEIDKLAGDSTAWSRGIQSEVWSTLDTSSKTPNMFIVGAGTWQDEHGKKTLGFKSKDVAVQFAGVPKELLHRFSHFLPISYPSPDETAIIFESTGLQKLASEIGVALSPEAHDWTGGVRSLEILCTQLFLESRKRGIARTVKILRQNTRPWNGTFNLP